MNFNKTWTGLTLVGAVLWLADTTTAKAELAACGGVFLSGDAKCEYREKEQCMTECKTTTVEKACVAKVYTSCENQCTETATTTCSSSCSQSCTSQCQTEVTSSKPANCMGLCTSDCQKSCRDGGRRGACCGYTCNDRCEEKCKDAPAQVTQMTECTNACMSACSGSCTAQVNVECQLNCQELTYTQCETELVETCETKCMDDGGAIFCDGQFVNASNAKSCADEIKAKINIDIDVKATANAAGDALDNAADKAEDRADDVCSVSAVGMGSKGLSSLALLSLSAGVLTVQRVRRRRGKRD